MATPPFRTAEQHVYLHLREQILSGQRPGGSRINPAEIAAELALSRMPVREALRQLDAEGLVTIQPNRRAVVTVLTAAEIEELFEIRAALESLAVRLALPNLTPEDFRRLQLINQLMEQSRLDPKRWVHHHSEFHDVIVERSGRQHLRKLISRIQAAVQPYILMYISVYHDPEMAGHEHNSVIAVLREGDAGAAEHCMADHIRSAAKGVIDFLVRRERQGAPAAVPDPQDQPVEVAPAAAADHVDDRKRFGV